VACSCLFHSHPHVHYFSSLSPSVDCIRAMMFHRVSVTSICTRVCLCLGVALASLGCGLGEFTFLSLTAHFDKWVKGCLKERLYHSSHFIPPYLNWPHFVCIDWQWVCCEATQFDMAATSRTRQHDSLHSDRSQCWWSSALHLTLTATQLRWNKISWDELRWD